jgi:hypothetical protein
MHTDIRDIFNDAIHLNVGTTQKIPPLAYIRELMPSEGEGYAICSDEGKVLASFATYESAFFTARQFRLTPLSIH